MSDVNKLTVLDNVGTGAARRAAPGLDGRETGLVALLPPFDRIEVVPTSLWPRMYRCSWLEQQCVSR